MHATLNLQIVWVCQLTQLTRYIQFLQVKCTLLHHSRRGGETTKLPVVESIVVQIQIFQTEMSASEILENCGTYRSEMQCTIHK